MHCTYVFQVILLIIFVFFPEDLEDTQAQLQLEFKVFLVNAQTQKHTQESRQLRFWFRSCVPEKERMRSAQEFFKELVAPLEFPRGE